MTDVSEAGSANAMTLRALVEELVGILNGPDNPVDIGDCVVKDLAGFVVTGVIVGHSDDGSPYVIIDTSEDV